MKKAANLFYSQKLAPYLFVLPFIVTLLLFYLVPIVQTIFASLNAEFFVKGVLTSEYPSLGNFKQLFFDSAFWTAVRNSMTYLLFTLLLLIPFPLLFATFLNNQMMQRGQNLFKSVLFVPALTSAVVGGIIFRLIFSESGSSMANQVIGLLGHEPIQWLRMRWPAMFALVLLACWRWTGVNILYFMSGLQSIPLELYEAAEIDGAGALQRFTQITLPQLKPTMVYVLTISIYGGLSMFTESYMYWSDNYSPQNIGLTIVGYLYKQGIEKQRVGFSAAIGLVLLGITLLINVVQLVATGTFRKEER